MAWALDEAPIANVYELGILAFITGRTTAGYGARLFQGQIAEKFRISVRTVRRHVGELERRGLIQRGDHRLVQHLPVDARPLVWDVPFPGRGLRPTTIPAQKRWESRTPPTAVIAARLSMWSGCWMCGGPQEVIDHVKPRAKGGADLPCNMRPACILCNSRKSDRWEGPRWAHQMTGARPFGGAA